MQKELTTKRLQIDKANLTVVIAVSIAAFITVFSLVAAKSLLSQRSYQARVIEKREEARDQLKENITAADQLTESYKQFVSSTVNAIGGNPTGSGERDGDNARIILDALPSKYDYPALATSLEKLAKSQGLSIQSIEGTDDEVNQAATEESPTPQAVDMPFTLVVNGDYAATQRLIDVFSKSIRPFYVDQLTFNASDKNVISLSVTGRSFYQPEKNLEFKSEVVK
jgi:hypothetical protein